MAKFLVTEWFSIVLNEQKFIKFHLRSRFIDLDHNWWLYNRVGTRFM